MPHGFCPTTSKQEQQSQHPTRTAQYRTIGGIEVKESRISMGRKTAPGPTGRTRESRYLSICLDEKFLAATSNKCIATSNKGITTSSNHATSSWFVVQPEATGTDVVFEACHFSPGVPSQTEKRL